MTDSALTFSLDNLTSTTDPVPLLHTYPGQINPQPAYVELSEGGQVSADYSGDISGTPARVYHMRDLAFKVSPYAHPVVLAKLLTEGAARPLLERIHAGHSVDWDGSNNRGSLTDDAQAASDALESLLDNTFGAGDPDTCVQVQDAGDWLFNCCTLADHWTTQPLAEAAAAIKAAALADGVTLTGDISRELLGAAERAFSGPTCTTVTAPQVAALLADGRIPQSLADGWTMAQRIRAATTRAELDVIALELQGLAAVDLEGLAEADPTSLDDARAILLEGLED